MEDAMILNKSAHERGFGYGTIYKSQIVDLKDVPGSSKSSANTLHFGLHIDVKKSGKNADPCLKFLEMDGLPLIGAQLKAGDPIAAYWNETTNRTKFV